eukprot:7182211-Pyramimonas_sp.AAC.1
MAATAVAWSNTFWIPVSDCSREESAMRPPTGRAVSQRVSPTGHGVREAAAVNAVVCVGEVSVVDNARRKAQTGARRGMMCNRVNQKI